jgi:aromatic-L-amino-acid decarboxylase
VFLVHTKLNGRIVIRLAIGNARTTREHVVLAWDLVRNAATALRDRIPA